MQLIITHFFVLSIYLLALIRQSPVFALIPFAFFLLKRHTVHYNRLCFILFLCSLGFTMSLLFLDLLFSQKCCFGNIKVGVTIKIKNSLLFILAFTANGINFKLFISSISAISIRQDFFSGIFVLVVAILAVSSTLAWLVLDLYGIFMVLKYFSHI